MRNDEAADIEMHVQAVLASIGRLSDAIGDGRLSAENRRLLSVAADLIENMVSEVEYV